MIEPITAAKPSWIRRFIFSTDHKTIAKQYLAVGLIFMAVGGLMAFIIRWQLAHPWQPVPVIGPWIFPESGGAVMPEIYTKLFTAHGGIMVFFAITPIILGALGNFTIPLEVGARDMAFPRLNMYSFWALCLGSVLVVASLFVPGGTADTGWTLYPPLSASIKMSPNWGLDLFILGLALDAVSILMGGINYISTILKCRAKGLCLKDVPLTGWGLFFSSVLNTLWLPVIAVALFMVLLDRRFGTAFFIAGPLAPHGGGQALLFQHLFWGFGHPEVYILIFPVWGLVGDLLSIFSRKPAFGYKATVLSMLVITMVSGVVWGHHMFTTGMNPLLGKMFMFLTISVSVPTAVFFFNWLATLWRGSIRFTLPMHHALGIIFVFGIGGLTGLFHAMQAFDVYIHDTYFVVGHFHFTLAASVLLGVFAFISFWFPKMFGRLMNETLGKIHFWLSFVSLNVLFTLMMVAGLHGHLRRLADPTEYEFLKPIQYLNEIMGPVAMVLIFSQSLFFFNILWSIFFGKKAGSNPWQAAGIAWAAASPPPHGNFESPPLIYGGPHEYGVKNPGGTDFYPQNEPCGRKLPVGDFSEWISLTKLGMWVFLVSEIMLFGSFIGAYIVLRMGSEGWPNPAHVLSTGLLGVNTFVLICSSLTFALAVESAKRAETAKTRRYLLGTAALGAAFLLIKGLDYAHLWREGFRLSSGLFGSCYYLLTGFHGLHVFSGVVLILYLWAAAGREGFLSAHAQRVESSGLYWHFIDIVWVLLFVVLCLL